MHHIAANIPEFFVVSPEEDDGTARIHSEWRRTMLDGLVDDRDDELI